MAAVVAYMMNGTFSLLVGTRSNKKIHKAAAVVYRMNGTFLTAGWYPFKLTM
jgi:hypothetical protein